MRVVNAPLRVGYAGVRVVDAPLRVFGAPVRVVGAPMRVGLFGRIDRCGRQYVNI